MPVSASPVNKPHGLDIDTDATDIDANDDIDADDDDDVSESGGFSL